MSQEQKNKTGSQTEEVVQDELEVKDQSELTESVEDILDDIDEILEENAQEFVAAYVQKGGE